MVPWYQNINTYIMVPRYQYMQKTVVDKKLADWVSTLNSIPNKEAQEARILQSLILEYRSKPKTMEEPTIAI